jgi:hypothetical protein
MAKSKPKTLQFERDGVTVGAYQGTALAAEYQSDPAWRPTKSDEHVASTTEKVGRGADYSKLPVEELRQIAAQRGVDDAEQLSKRDAIKAIEAAEKAAEDQPPAA